MTLSDYWLTIRGSLAVGLFAPKPFDLKYILHFKIQMSTFFLKKMIKNNHV
jgi:hypothetical protein